MKTTSLLFAVLFTLFAFTATAVASDNGYETVANKTVEANLLMGINSDNEGLRISSAYYLGEIKSEAALIPLMKMVRDEKNPGARIMAALSLVKLENPQGLFLVKRTAEFNTSGHVRNVTDKIYFGYLLKKHIEKNPEQEQLFAGLIF